jgi:hypothetical protein
MRTDRIASLMADTILFALAFNASSSESTLTIDHWYFEYKRKANQGDLRDHFDAAAALGLADQADAAPVLAQKRFGRMALLAETTYDARTARHIFLDGNGAARPREVFERAGRQAVALLEAGDPDESARAILASNDKLFRDLVRVVAPQPAMDELKKQRFQGEPIPLPVLNTIYGDFIAIFWWSNAMHSLAVKLSALHALRNSLPANVPPDAANAYRKLRKDLQDALADVARSTQPRFKEPWGLVAMYLASEGRAGAHVRITSDEFQYDRSRRWS